MGSAVGGIVGEVVGGTVGAAVGAVVGPAVGVAVGVAVGAFVDPFVLEVDFVFLVDLAFNALLRSLVFCPLLDEAIVVVAVAVSVDTAFTKNI